MDWTDIASATSNIVTALIALFALLNWIADKDIERRRFTLTLLRDFTDSITPERAAARRLLDSVSRAHPQLANTLAARKSVTLPLEYKDLIEQSLGTPKTDGNDVNGVDVTAIEANRIISEAVQHMNAFEILLEAWLDGSADPRMIREQLQGFYDAANKQLAFYHFRTQQGIQKGFEKMGRFEQDPNYEPNFPKNIVLATLRKWLVSPYCCEAHDPRNR